ncbi:hypothetical protein [Falsiroseomonas sp. CW058]|uniref:hypothetical protein n=1 Tax=Falsiroseomonas sp. CW058 TaxID=3388664 RepID=UPI003D31F2A9
MTDPAGIDIEAAGIAATIESLAAEEVDRLPFGVIRLDPAGVVTQYSRLERHLSGYRREAVGRDFFAEIAPCMDNAAFRGRIERARTAGRLDIVFDYVSDMPNGARDVELRVRVVSALDGGCWILMQRDA